MVYQTEFNSMPNEWATLRNPVNVTNTGFILDNTKINLRVEPFKGRTQGLLEWDLDKTVQIPSEELREYVLRGIQSGALNVDQLNPFPSTITPVINFKVVVKNLLHQGDRLSVDRAAHDAITNAFQQSNLVKLEQPRESVLWGSHHQYKFPQVGFNVFPTVRSTIDEIVEGEGVFSKNPDQFQKQGGQFTRVVLRLEPYIGNSQYLFTSSIPDLPTGIMQVIVQYIKASTRMRIAGYGVFVNIKVTLVDLQINNSQAIEVGFAIMEAFRNGLNKAKLSNMNLS